MPNTTDAIVVRPGSKRGHTQLGWLDSYHSFSFGDYRDINHMGFLTLRVINDDVIAPGGGFGEHPHRDMEIITWVLDGELKHADSLGHESVIRHGDLQTMTAGKGIRHSEFNASLTQPVHLLQVWIIPNKKGLTPGYDQKTFDPESRTNQFCLVVSGDGREGSLMIHQDADLWIGEFDAGHSTTFELAPSRRAWLQVARGRLQVNGQSVGAGDGLATVQPVPLEIEAREDAELLLFGLPFTENAR